MAYFRNIDLRQTLCSRRFPKKSFVIDSAKQSSIVRDPPGHISCATCHMSCVTCHIFTCQPRRFLLLFLVKVVELYGGGSVNNRSTRLDYPLSSETTINFLLTSAVWVVGQTTKKHNLSVHSAQLCQISDNNCQKILLYALHGWCIRATFCMTPLAINIH